MTLQELMDEAMILALKEQGVEDIDNLLPHEFQSLNDLQTEKFIELGGDVDAYYLECQE